MRVFWCLVLFLSGALIFFLSPVSGEVQVYVGGGIHSGPVSPVQWPGEQNPGQPGVSGFSVNDIPDSVIQAAKTDRVRILPELVRGEMITPPNISDLQVEFSGAPTSGRAPLLVFFIDLTKGSPISWVWDFGDGVTGLGENALHEYSKAGIYTVQLTVSNQDGDSGTRVKKQYITVRPLPVEVNFTAAPSRGEAPLTVEFTDQSTGAMFWSWDFGDGSLGSMIPNPSHTFTLPGV
ncbi:MAG: hypothetical protein CVV33_08745, partial [Methanomicrobiales archaeon HGW-Methanomicrobiales-4]